MLACPLIAILLGSSACGSSGGDTPSGGLAVGTGSSGHPVVALKVCGGTFDHIELREMLGDGKSKVIAALETSDPVSGDATVDLVQPSGGWKASIPLTETPGLITANAWGANKKSGASNQATFTFRDLAALPNNEVISDLGPEASKAASGQSGPSMTLSAFKKNLCSRWG